ncbi:hypothetical protein [Escherichia coli]|nr:hypothetical protein [Escherichia coli]
MYRAHGQKIFPGHGEHGDITVGLTDYPYSCFIIAAGIFFKQVRNIFLHTVIGSAGEVGKKQPGFIICSSGLIGCGYPILPDDAYQKNITIYKLSDQFLKFASFMFCLVFSW